MHFDLHSRPNLLPGRHGSMTIWVHGSQKTLCHMGIRSGYGGTRFPTWKNDRDPPYSWFHISLETWGPTPKIGKNATQHLLTLQGTPLAFSVPA